MNGTSDQSYWLAEACRILLLLLVPRNAKLLELVALRRLLQ